MATHGYNLTATVNNMNVAYDDLGEGTTPVIFLHGFPFNRTMWKEQLEALQSETRVIACDLRGFGKSEDETSFLSIDQFADDLIGFMDALRIEKAIICGLSMGGYIALNAVNRFKNRFEALILCDTQCYSDTAEAKQKRYASMDEISTDGISAFNEPFLKSVCAAKTLETKPEVIEALREMVYSTSEHSLTMGLTALAERHETCSILSNIDMPALIICGSEDAVTPPEKSEYLHEQIYGSVLRIIDEAGHVSNLEQPELFNTHILHFIHALDTIHVEKQASIKK